jgi:hypothetical protein
MDVNEWMSYECTDEGRDEGTHVQNIHYSSTRSDTSEEENRTVTRNRKCWQVLKLRAHLAATLWLMFDHGTQPKYPEKTHDFR